MADNRYIISDAAKLVDVEPHVLRYWEDELGLEIPRNELGHRYYTDRELKIFANVRDLKDKGFQLKAIKLILATVSGEVQPARKIISIEDLRKGVTALETDDFNQDTIHRDFDSQTEEAHMETEHELTEAIHDNLPEAETLPTPENAVARITAEEKMNHFKYIMDDIIFQALRENNIVLEKMLKDLDDREELRYKRMDETIRSHQRGTREAAAAKAPGYIPQRSKRGFGGLKNRSFWKRRVKY